MSPHFKTQDLLDLPPSQFLYSHKVVEFRQTLASTRSNANLVTRPSPNAFRPSSRAALISKLNRSWNDSGSFSVRVNFLELSCSQELARISPWTCLKRDLARNFSLPDHCPRAQSVPLVSGHPPCFRVYTGCVPPALVAGTVSLSSLGQSSLPPLLHPSVLRTVPQTENVLK